MNSEINLEAFSLELYRQARSLPETGPGSEARLTLLAICTALGCGRFRFERIPPTDERTGWEDYTVKTPLLARIIGR
jgi:hypothetical protein